ncbi:MlaE family lipid ABC transporter permease subunit [Sulfurimonas sp.]|jgi:phospholipid/cholesterol/gamma-HCH transport system permease protein|uniref:MlaE family lipid ABC transporter permease subunit n=1 Tax=Sulfurimonas sp. TaxID=2022749 RepID=UPI0025D2DD44|nr:MlaE family lipid ABC transporter permease subunit [Sulfurimonas sp.]MBT5934495.1 MlaE family lipid ABC transporter permease subunit [Sulfurimonas sp.]
MHTLITIQLKADKLFLNFSGEITVYTINILQNKLLNINTSTVKEIVFDLNAILFLDTAGALFLNKLQHDYEIQTFNVKISSHNKKINDTLELVENYKIDSNTRDERAVSSLHIFYRKYRKYIEGVKYFMEFLGRLFMSIVLYLKSFKSIRYKEIFFEINESGVKALWIVSLTSFLIGLVVAFQSSYQLKIYGANIFIVDMLGLSILRELAPVITAIVIAGRSGSAFTAQIGAMKITQEIDAMKTMGFDPYSFLLLPRIIALMIILPILVFVSDIMGMLGGMIVANIDLGITVEVFTSRFQEVIKVKHFYVGILKAPFFAFLIASIGIYRGLVVKDDTKSIGINTTKSVVESIFAVIVCDALFSIAFTSVGI